MSRDDATDLFSCLQRVDVGHLNSLLVEAISSLDRTLGAGATREV